MTMRLATEKCLVVGLSVTLGVLAHSSAFAGTKYQTSLVPNVAGAMPGFAADISADPAFAGATLGDGVAVGAVRVKDSTGTVLGVGGFAVE